MDPAQITPSKYGSVMVVWKGTLWWFQVSNIVSVQSTVIFIWLKPPACGSHISLENIPKPKIFLVYSIREAKSRQSRYQQNKPFTEIPGHTKGSLPFLRSLLHLSFALLVLDSATPDASTSLRSSAQLDPAPLVLGMSCFGASLLVTGFMFGAELLFFWRGNVVNSWLHHPMSRRISHRKKNNWGWTFGFSTLSLHIYALMSCLSKSLFDALIYGIKRDSRLWDTHLLQVATNFLHGDTVFWGFGTGPSHRKASWDFFTSFLLANSILKFGNAWAKNWVASKYSLTFVVSKSRAPRILAFVAKKSWCFCKTVRSFSPRVRFLDGYFSISHRIYMVTFTIDIPPLC